MAILLENARLCLDCDMVFEEARCPSCSSETFFPLSRWVRPHIEAAEPQRVSSKKVRNASLMLAGSGVAYALYKLLKSTDKKSSDNNEPKPKK
jgi:hypothetical protein